MGLASLVFTFSQCRTTVLVVAKLPHLLVINFYQKIPLYRFLFSYIPVFKTLYIVFKKRV